MAGVRVLTGPPLEAPLYEINDKSTAALHAGLRAGDAISRLREDCRPLAELMDEAEKAAWLGHPDRETFILKVLSWPVQTIDLALEGLRWFDPSEPVPLDVAATKGAEVAERAAAAPCEVGPGQGARTDLKPRADGTKLSRGSNSAPYLAARIKRDFPEIAEKLLAGEFTSMRQAAIAAGIVKEKSKLDRLISAWNAASEDDRKTFVAAIVRPGESEEG